MNLRLSVRGVAADVNAAKGAYWLAFEKRFNIIHYRLHGRREYGASWTAIVDLIQVSIGVIVPVIKGT